MSTLGELKDVLNDTASDIADVLPDLQYWPDAVLGKIQRANLDGTQVEDHILELGFIIGLAVDSEEEKIYWSAPGADKIQVANMDGSNIEDVVTGIPLPVEIALWKSGSNENRAIVISDEYCQIADGSIFSDPSAWPRMVETNDGKVVQTNSAAGNVIKTCDFKDVFNDSGKAIHYDYQSIIDFYGYKFPCTTEQGQLSTNDWRVTISAGGAARLFCEFK